MQAARSETPRRDAKAIVRLLHSFPALRSVVQSLVVAFKNVVYLLFLVRATTLSLSTHQHDTTTDTFS